MEQMFVTIREGKAERQVNVAPLLQFIEDNNLEEIIRTIRNVQLNYSCLLMENSLDPESTRYINEGVPDEIFTLKELADALQEGAGS